MPEKFSIKTFFASQQLPVIAGPCVIESRDHTLFMAEKIAGITDRLNLPYIFKSSFDKANRTSIHSYRGPGLETGLEVLQAVKEKIGCPVLTDIHRPDHTAPVADVVDVLQIPAFLCRQTDLLIAAAQTGKAINVKKGQFLAPLKMKSVVDKLTESGAREILLTERGTTFGYESLVADMRSIPQMQQFGYPVIFDATHSAQMPRATGDHTGGAREFIPVVARAAVAAGCDGLFLEVHDNVSHAKSDAATQWPLDRLEMLLSQLTDLRKVVNKFNDE